MLAERIRCTLLVPPFSVQKDEWPALGLYPTDRLLQEHCLLLEWKRQLQLIDMPTLPPQVEELHEATLGLCVGTSCASAAPAPILGHQVRQAKDDAQSDHDQYRHHAQVQLGGG